MTDWRFKMTDWRFEILSDRLGVRDHKLGFGNKWPQTVILSEVEGSIDSKTLPKHLT